MRDNQPLMLAILFAGAAIAGALVFFSTQFGISNSNKEEILQIVDEYTVGAIKGDIIPGQYQDDYTAPTPPAAPQPETITADDDAMLGDAKAELTIIEFSDYECPFCKKFIDGAYQDIKSKYVKTGKVNLVFRDFPLSFHEGAVPAALAAECAKEQGDDTTYFAYHDLLFADQKLDRESLISYASKLNLDKEQFTSCLDDQKYLDEIQKDFKDGQIAGINGTPAFIIDGKVISGAQPFSVFQAAIDEALAK